MKSLFDGGCSDYMQKTVGLDLTEENVDALQGWFNSKAQQNDYKATPAAENMSLTARVRRECDRLTAVVASQNLDPKSYLGQKFRDFLANDDSNKEIFKKLASTKAKADFKVAWAATQLEHLRESKMTKKSHSKVDLTKGRYYNFSRVVVEFGGWQSSEAVNGATTACGKCLAMGTPWVMRHPQSGLATFLILEQGFDEMFESSWTTCREEFSKEVVVQRQTAGIEDQGKKKEEKVDQEKGTGKGTKPTKADKDKEKDLDKTKDKEKEKKTLKPPPDMDIATLWREAMKLKVVFQSSMSVGSDLDNRISCDKAWCWAKGAKFDQLVEHKQNVKKVLSAWHEEFLMTTHLATFKKAHMASICHSELVSFLMNVSGPINSLSEFCSNLQKAHQFLAVA
jgi:hypothetical protein